MPVERPIERLKRPPSLADSAPPCAKHARAQQLRRQACRPYTLTNAAHAAVSQHERAGVKGKLHESGFGAGLSHCAGLSAVLRDRGCLLHCARLLAYQHPGVLPCRTSPFSRTTDTVRPAADEVLPHT